MNDKRYELVLFDFDGTLVDTFEGIGKSAAYALKKGLGIEVNDIEELRFFFGPPLINTFIEHYNLSEERAFEMVNLYRERYKPIGIKECCLYDGTVEALARLKAGGIKLAVASSKPLDMIESIMARFGIREYFSCVEGVEHAIREKSKSQCIADAIEKLGYQKELNKVVMTGDRSNDAEGAKNNGIDFIPALYGGGPDNSEFLAYRCVYPAQDIRDTASYVLGEL